MIVGERAVVLGGSLAGLCAARVLADAFMEVTVVDRDVMDPGTGARRGVPQGRHTHVLISRGQQALEELFPGLVAQLVREGAPTFDHLADVRWIISGRRLAREQSGLPVVSPSRPLLERTIRDRVTSLPGVTLVGAYDAAGLTSSADHRQVVGARVIGRADGSAEQILAADLVVDATGRGSRASAWLEELGCAPAEVESVPIDLSYTTAVFATSSLNLDGDQGIVVAPSPQHPRGGALQLLEGDRTLVTLAGVLGDGPRPDRDGFLEFVDSMAFGDLRVALNGAQWLSEPVRYRFRASVRHRFERLRDFPNGFLVLGDALCSFNPLYAQGMTVAALEALSLRRHLAGASLPPSRDVLRDLSAAIEAPWSMAAGADLTFPGLPGRPSVVTRLGNAYLARLHAAAERDAHLSTTFMRVAGLLDPPSTLMRPSVALRVLRSTRHQAPVASASVGTPADA